MKVLITSGGTEEKIDGVRSIVNFSSGRTGSIIADFFQEQGAKVTYLHGKRAFISKKATKKIPFFDFSSLNSLIKKILGEESFDAIIHLAAVSDYSVAEIEVDKKIFRPDQLPKIDSGREINIKLVPNFKILDKLREYHGCNDNGCDPLLVGFKLTNTESMSIQEKAIEKILPKVDFLVHNDLKDISPTFHKANIHSKGGVVARSTTKLELAQILYELLTCQEKRK